MTKREKESIKKSLDVLRNSHNEFLTDINRSTLIIKVMNYHDKFSAIGTSNNYGTASGILTAPY